jgi:hypothetical protein
MRYRKILSRRTFLRGAGTVAIGLPLLDEMLTTSVYAAAPEPPARSILIFFGEGLPVDIQNAHLPALDGPFEPLSPFRSKLGFVKGIGLPQRGGAHDASIGVFVGDLRAGGKDGVDIDRAAGPSVDQVMLGELYPAGLPPEMIPTLAMGFYGSYRDPATSENRRRVKSWNDAGNPSETPRAYPSDLFDRVFGTTPELGDDRRARSILDTVLEQYRHYSSEASGLGAASRARLSEHLERVRQYEARAFGDGMRCVAPPPVDDPPLYHGQTSHNGVDLEVEEITAHWRLNCDLLTMALRCDMTRFAVAHFLNVGDRIDLRGDYRYDGRLVYSFNDRRDQMELHPGETDESLLVNHEAFHDWDRNDLRELLPHHLHFHMREIGYLLGLLDDAGHTDENGGTLLDNAMILGATENSEPGAHSVNNLVHFMSGANERFRVGGTITEAGTGRRPIADLYNTVLRAYGISRTMAPGQFSGDLIDEIYG